MSHLKGYFNPRWSVSSDAVDENGYYANLARTVEFVAQAENWNKEQKIQMLSNPPKFEKYYQKWQDRNMGKDPKVPACAKRLQKDAMQRLEQKMRNEEKKRWEQKLEEDKIIRQQKNMVK